MPFGSCRLYHIYIYIYILCRGLVVALDCAWNEMNGMVWHGMYCTTTDNIDRGWRLDRSILSFMKMLWLQHTYIYIYIYKYILGTTKMITNSTPSIDRMNDRMRNENESNRIDGRMMEFYYSIKVWKKSEEIVWKKKKKPDDDEYKRQEFNNHSLN